MEGDLLKQVGEKCNGYSILHSKCEDKFARINNYLSIPVIILSTLVGATSVGSEALFGTSPIAPIAIGGISILTGIFQTINSYFSFQKRQETHRMTSISYKKLYRFIHFELALGRHQRMPPKALIKFIRNETDRLTETAPNIPKDIIEWFNSTYKEPNVFKPEEVNGLGIIEINRNEYKPESFQDILQKISMNIPISASNLGTQGTLNEIGIDISSSN